MKRSIKLALGALMITGAIGAAATSADARVYVGVGGGPYYGGPYGCYYNDPYYCGGYGYYGPAVGFGWGGGWGGRGYYGGGHGFHGGGGHGGGGHGGGGHGGGGGGGHR